MIAYLRGTPQLFGTKLVLICAGVGYGITTTNSVLQLAAAQQSKQSELSLHVYTHVKEDALELFGFATLQEKELFQLLISVSGVGPATAIAILDKGAAATIAAIQAADVAYFTSVKRVGKKAGQKIIIELKAKLGGLNDLDLSPLTQTQTELSEALQTLGFSEAAVASVLTTPEIIELPLEKALHKALQALGKNTETKTHL